MPEWFVGLDPVQKALLAGLSEAQQGGDNDLATASALIGFTLMMVLDVAFG